MLLQDLILLCYNNFLKTSQGKFNAENWEESSALPLLKFLFEFEKMHLNISQLKLSSKVLYVVNEKLLTMEVIFHWVPSLIKSIG